MTEPHGLPYAGALDAVSRIETALSERDAARDATDSVLEAAHAEAERLLSAARTVGMRAGQDRRIAILTRARAESQAIRSDGDAEAEQLASRMAAARDVLAAELMPLLLVEEP
jgi:vacuolar-type H+-ATPase subunit H